MTNYIKTPVGELPARVSFRTLRDLAKLTGVKKLLEIDKIIHNLEIAHFPKACFYAFRDGAKKEGFEFDYKVEAVENWLDEDFTIVTEVIKLIGALLNPPKDDKEGKQAAPATP